MATARIHDDPDLLNPTPAHWNIVQTKNLVGASMENWLKNFSEQTGWETYYPLVSELRAVPQRKLSYAQRRSLVVIKRRCACPFIPGKVFVRRRRPQMICRSDITHFPNVFGLGVRGRGAGANFPSTRLQSQGAREGGRGRRDSRIDARGIHFQGRRAGADRRGAARLFARYGPGDSSHRHRGH